MAARVDDGLAQSLLGQAVYAIELTTDPDQLKAYAQTIQALLAHADNDLVLRLIGQVAEAMQGAMAPDRLRAYVPLIQAINAHIDASLAQHLITQAVDAIQETLGRWTLSAYAKSIQAWRGVSTTTSPDACSGKRSGLFRQPRTRTRFRPMRRPSRP